MKGRRDTGIVEWFHVGDEAKVDRTLEKIDNLQIKQLRTGISWADHHEDSGEEWYQYLLPRLANKVEILPCILYTPPSLGIEPRTSSPPRSAKDYADFVDYVLGQYGQNFNWVELWNEPNNRLEYDYTLDNDWMIFADMIVKAAYWAQHNGYKVALGGMSPVDANWLHYMFELNAMTNIDAVGIHGFPGSYDQIWSGWNNNIAVVQEVLDHYNHPAEVWITEAGFSTWKNNEDEQVAAFTEYLDSPAQRKYWYSIEDLNANLPTVGGFYKDKRDYHFGLYNSTGKPKLLARLWEEQGLDNTLDLVQAASEKAIEATSAKRKSALITGGAGFVGTNLTKRLLDEGYVVTIYDNCSRGGVEHNLDYLLSLSHPHLEVIIGDVRERHKLENAVKGKDVIYHLAAQVAVTHSVDDPLHDYEVNVLGTVQLLEAVRRIQPNASLIFTSTNKVYGNLTNYKFVLGAGGYEPEDKQLFSWGISEKQPLDFHSPYGCSKGRR